MKISTLKHTPDFYSKGCIGFILDKTAQLPSYIKETDFAYIKNQLDLEKTIIPVYNSNQTSYLVVINADENLENFRKKANELFSEIKANKETEVLIIGEGIDFQKVLAFAESLALSGYQFLKYFKEEDQTKKKQLLKQINIFHANAIELEISHLNNIIEAVFWARNMVNEPVIALNATQFAQQVKTLGKSSGLNIEVLDKKKIEALKMGGLLAVNKGSIDPPTFTVLEWKPENATNNQPYVLVGKGVVYDTGGLSLKSTANSMDEMKCDMAGAAAVAGALYATALNKIPLWIIGLLPATDNRPDGNAYTPGDVIQMYNGLYVEVMNTDAEGRLIMADALSYGDKYNPQLVIDVATLTGSAQSAIGKFASVYMGNADAAHFETLKIAGENTHERLVQFPFWDDYKEALKSPIADLKNVGEREGGAISAGKFLEHFTKSPYIHIDIAGTAFLKANDAYRLKGGTGVGVRMLTEFFKIVSKPPQKS
jgi:leucyl aminopeptidase